MVRPSLMFVALLTLLTLPVKAQTFQFLPEVDAYSRVNSDVPLKLAHPGQ